jgi:AAA+ ATPase superfamily predicted ATPase
MAGIVTILIGRRKTGKTTLSKKFLDNRPSNMPVMIYDINKEYSKYYPEKFVDFDIFLSKITDEKVRHTYILIEEATIFFDTSSRFEEMKNLLVRARHTGNIIQLNFHSWLSVPKNIFNLSDYIIVFKTNDTIMTVKSKYDNEMLLNTFDEANKSKDEYFNKTVSLY